MVVRHGDTSWLAAIDDQPEEDAFDEEAKVGVKGDEGRVNIGGWICLTIVCNAWRLWCPTVLLASMSPMEAFIPSLTQCKNQYTGLNAQFQMIIHMLQPAPPPPFAY
ncbi:hypothetical protein JCGZ_03274 [Jatropha curcas]|uniref:Uncharacterized protein n=1 Tax=Jatropha curcas TaxID=180498 RepID=A0A067JG54_JATCU|nr:hypothetical protein JCGZ_03274 [Jatropha curcas]